MTIRAKRLDIQGLRMVAVLAVVVNHVSGHALPGGFAGVDVFFVISGYLITGRLIRTVGTKRPAAYFGSFYQLRARRILPAAIVTLAATVVLGHRIFFGSRAASINTDALWALFFGANWHFAGIGTNYFTQDQATSPLQHYWSLSVEEQFYVVWPLLILLVGGWWARRSGGAPLLAVRICAIAVIVLSFAWGWHQTTAAPATAYFSTFARAWELAAGALLATVPVGRIRALQSSLGSTAASWLGFALVGAALVTTPDGDGFPVPWAVPAVAGSALVILAGLERQPRNAFLRNPLSVWLGDLSYSIYLVHFPIWIFLDALMPTPRHYLYAAFALSVAAAATISYYFVEEPGRRGLRSLLPLPGARRSTAIRAVACVVTAAVAFTLIIFRPTSVALPDNQLTMGLPRATWTAQERAEDRWMVDPLPEVREAIKEGLTLTSWPEISNADTTALFNCSDHWSIEDACTWTPKSGRDPKKVVLLIGDSVMRSWLPMMSKAFLQNGWTVVSIAQVDCFAADTHYADMIQPNAAGRLTQNTDCDRQHDFYAEALDEVKPTLVVLDDMADAIAKVSDGKGHLLKPRQQEQAYAVGLKKTVALVKTRVKKVLMLSSNPNEISLEDCRVGSATPQDCLSGLSQRWLTIRHYDQIVARKGHVIYADLQNFWCYEGLCPPVVAHHKVVVSGHNLTIEFASYLADSFSHYLQQAGLV